MMQQATKRAPHAEQIPLQSKRSRYRLLKRFFYVTTLITVILETSSTICPVMTVKNPYLANAWAVEYLTLAAVTYYTFEELEEVSKSDTARQPQVTMARRADRASCTPLEQLARLSLDQVLFSAAQPVVKIFSEQRLSARAPRASAGPVSLVVWGTPSTGYYCTLGLGTPQEKVMRSRGSGSARVCYACVWSVRWAPSNYRHLFGMQPHSIVAIYKQLGIVNCCACMECADTVAGSHPHLLLQLLPPSSCSFPHPVLPDDRHGVQQHGRTGIR